MLSIVSAALKKESSEYRFRFGCEACAYFDPDARRCGNGYPIEPHLELDLECSSEISFCKEFELY